MSDLPKEALHELGFWGGGPNDDYFRNPTFGRLEMRRRVLEYALGGSVLVNIASILDVGCGCGHDLSVYSEMVPNAKLFGIEPCAVARESSSQLAAVVEGNVYNTGGINRTFDLVQTHGMLIHVPPEAIEIAYRSLGAVVGRYLLLMEYYSKEPAGTGCYATGNGCWRRDYGKEASELLGLSILNQMPLEDGCYAWLMERT